MLSSEPLCQRVDPDNLYSCEPKFAGFNATSRAFVVVKGITTGVGHAFPEREILCAIGLHANFAYSPFSELSWSSKTHGLNDFFERSLGLGLGDTQYKLLLAWQEAAARSNTSANFTQIDLNSCPPVSKSSQRTMRSYVRTRFAQRRALDGIVPDRRLASEVHIGVHVRRGDTLVGNRYTRNYDGASIPEAIYAKAVETLIAAVRADSDASGLPRPRVIVHVESDGCGRMCNYAKAYVDEFGRAANFTVPSADAVHIHVGDDNNPIDSLVGLGACDILLVSCSGFARRVAQFYAHGLVVSMAGGNCGQPSYAGYLGNGFIQLEAFDHCATDRTTAADRGSIMTAPLLGLGWREGQPNFNVSRAWLLGRATPAKLAHRLRGVELRFASGQRAAFRTAWARYIACGQLCPRELAPPILVDRMPHPAARKLLHSLQPPLPPSHGHSSGAHHNATLIANATSRNGRNGESDSLGVGFDAASCERSFDAPPPLAPPEPPPLTVLPPLPPPVPTMSPKPAKVAARRRTPSPPPRAPARPPTKARYRTPPPPAKAQRSWLLKVLSWLSHSE